MARVLDVEFLVPGEALTAFLLGQSCFGFLACVRAKGRSEKSAAANPTGRLLGFYGTGIFWSRAGVTRGLEEGKKHGKPKASTQAASTSSPCFFVPPGSQQTREGYV